jgi:hypothetical protein
MLGQHAEQLNAEALPLPTVIDHYRKLGVERFASRVLRHSDDARSRPPYCLADEGEMAWRTRTRDPFELIRREFTQRGEEAVSARPFRETAHELLNGRGIFAACNPQRD